MVSGDTFPSSNYWMGSVFGDVTPGPDSYYIKNSSVTRKIILVNFPILIYSDNCNFELLQKKQSVLIHITVTDALNIPIGIRS